MVAAVVKVVAAAAVLILAGCARPLPPNIRGATTTHTPTFCEVAKPMTLALNDSPQTQSEIRSFNATVAKHCGSEAVLSHVK